MPKLNKNIVRRLRDIRSRYPSRSNNRFCNLAAKYLNVSPTTIKSASIKQWASPEFKYYTWGNPEKESSKTINQDMFTCDLCNNTYEKAWSDEESMAEAHEKYGEKLSNQPMSILCDSCHKDQMRWGNSRLQDIK